MKASRNRLTPFLVIILIILIWILVSLILYKLMRNGSFSNVKRLKLDDDLVQELYSYITDEDIIIYADKEYQLDNLPDTYIFSKATRFMTIEDVALTNNNQFKISYESLDSAIKTAFGPDIKYDLSKLNSEIKTDFELNDHKLLFNVKYDNVSNSYIGTYTEIVTSDSVLVHHELIMATKNDTVNLKVGYLFYKQGDKYEICDDYTCQKIVKEVDNLDNYEYDKFITVSLKKASDEVYYYSGNS